MREEVPYLGTLDVDQTLESEVSGSEGMGTARRSPPLGGTTLSEATAVVSHVHSLNRFCAQSRRGARAPGCCVDLMIDLRAERAAS